jgi:hypothetical protein
LAIALATLAVPPSLGLPPWPLSPDGELVAAAPGVALEAGGGTVEPVAPGLWRVVPDEGAREVRLSAGAERSTAAVKPPPGVVEIGWEPAAPVKGRDREATLWLSVRTADGAPDADGPAPRLVASAGQVGPLSPAGPGRWRAAYGLPATRWPEVVAFLASSTRCPACATPRAAGAAHLPLAAAIELPGRTDGRVEVTVEIGGATWGPVRADQTGSFRLPVVVPPGIGTGTVHSISAAGNVRRTGIDLGLPPTPRLACTAVPARLPADGRARATVLCTAFSADGTPAPGAAVELSAARGALAPARWEGSLLRATWRAPEGGPGSVRIVAAWRAAGEGGSAEAEVVLEAGGPATIEWRVEGEPLQPGEAARFEAVARDERGEPLGEAEARWVDGRPLEGGRLAAFPWSGALEERVALSFAPPPTREAQTLSLRREGDAWVAEARGAAGRPAEGVPLAWSTGARSVTDARGEARAAGGGAAAWVKGPDGLRAAAWSWAPPHPRPAAVAREVSVALRPPGTPRLAAWLEGRTLRWTVDAQADGGEPRRVVLRPGGVALGPPAAGQGGGWCEVLGGTGPVAVVDEATGAGVVVEVP